MENQNTNQITETPTTPPDTSVTQHPVIPKTNPPIEHDEKPSGKNKTKLVLVAIIVVIAALFITGIFVFQQQRLQNHEQIPTPTKTVLAPTSLPTDTPVQNIQSSESSMSGETVAYSSENLSLTFSYAPTYSSWNYVAYILEKGNRISIGPKSYYDKDPEGFDSEYIEVYKVEEGLSVKEDIEKRFLSDYPAEDCYVADPIASPDPEDTTSTYPIGDNYRIITIEAAGPKDDMGVWMEAVLKCPLPYTTHNAVSFFAYDVTMPDNYIFYNLGQEAAWPSSTGAYEEGGSGVSWVQTIEFGQ